MDLNAQLETISSEQLDAMFSTPGADNLIVGKDESAQTPEIVPESGVPTLNLDDLDAEEEKPAEETKPPIEEQKPAEEKPADTEEEETETEDNTEDQEQIKTVLKTTVDYLVSKGLWKDWDGREELEIDSDTYAELAAKQEEAKVGELFDELVNSTGSYGKAIISHIKNGGNPDEIIDIFKEQKQVQSIDISDENGQTALISQYYTEVLGWSKQKVEKQINRLRSEEGELEEEAADVKEKFDEIYKERVTEINKREAEAKKEAEQRQQQYIQTLNTTIDTTETLSDKEKNLIKNSVLKFNKKLEDGTPVNDFYMKFYEIQNNPKEYVDLIHFIMDKEGYKTKISQKAETKAIDKTWNFVKSNGAVTKKGAQIPTKDSNKVSKIDFSSVLKKQK